ncbi:MAG TPA: hypothetical protein PLG03_05410 [Bacteroidales bacterium]|nr:hypothetical protein [Bacteroidales bacterium]
MDSSIILSVPISVKGIFFNSCDSLTILSIPFIKILCGDLAIATEITPFSLFVIVLSLMSSGIFTQL